MRIAFGASWSPARRPAQSPPGRVEHLEAGRAESLRPGVVAEPEHIGHGLFDRVLADERKLQLRREWHRQGGLPTARRAGHHHVVTTWHARRLREARAASGGAPSSPDPSRNGGSECEAEGMGSNAPAGQRGRRQQHREQPRANNRRLMAPRLPAGRPTNGSVSRRLVRQGLATSEAAGMPPNVNVRPGGRAGRTARLTRARSARGVGRHGWASRAQGERPARSTLRPFVHASSRAEGRPGRQVTGSP